MPVHDPNRLVQIDTVHWIEIMAAGVAAVFLGVQAILIHCKKIAGG